MANSKTHFIFKPLAFALDIVGIIAILVATSLDIIQNDSGIYKIGNQQIAIIVVGMALTVLAGSIIHHATIWEAVRSTKMPSFVMFVASILIFSTNLTGFFLPLRNPAVYEGIDYAGVERKVNYSAAEVYAQMDRIEEIDEQYPEYVKRLTQLIYDGTVHYWKYEENNVFNLRIPPHENYLIYFMQLKQGELANYEFCRSERAIERAVSVCSQASKIMADILLKNRVRAQIVGLEGHVVTRARVDNKTEEWWIVDADYGVVIEHDLDEIEANLDIVREAYQKHGYNDQIIENLVDIYGAADNQIIDKNLKCTQEDYLYLLKWLIPILGLLPFSMFMIMHFTRRKRG
jgi:RPA family protein